MSEKIRILIVDDDRAQAEMLCEFLRISGFDQVVHIQDIASLWPQLKEANFDLILLDYKLPDGTGLDVLAEMKLRGYRLPVVMVTGQGSERVAAQAIQDGAADYLIKSGDYLITLPTLIRKTMNAYQLQLSVERSLEQVRYQALLLNNVRDAIVVWDMNGSITYWNPAATSLFGWSAEERLGRPVGHYYLSAFKPPITIPKDGNPGNQPIVRQYNKRDGGTLWVSSRLAALHEPSQESHLIGYMDVTHDITDRVEMEQALRESAARYRAIVEDYQTELICRFQPNGTLIFVNEVFCRYFGKTRDQLLGMNFLYFVPESERSKLVQHLISFSPDRTVATLEHQVSVPEQGLRWLQRTDRAILDKRGRVFEFQSVARDITDKKEMEAQIQTAQSHLVQSARMATIGEMASGVAHQIYNPLTTIIADAQILLHKLPANQPGRDSAEAIEQAGWRLQQVVQRLMEFSRPESQAFDSLSVNETIQSALSLVGAHIKEAGCRLEVDLGDELPPVRGNPRQLENLWVNLLLLARDASAGGRGQTVRVRSRSETPESVLIEVADDGEPIPADKLAVVFEPNFISSISGRGTGMELSICREIVRQHGGNIMADSAPGRDTVFRVSLPAEV